MPASARLVDSRLVGAKRPAVLQHQGDNLKREMSGYGFDIRLEMDIDGTLSIVTTLRARPVILTHSPATSPSRDMIRGSIFARKAMHPRRGPLALAR